MVDEREIEAIRERHEDMVKYLASNGNKGPWDFIGQDAHADRATLLSALLAERERVAALEAAAQKALQALRRNQAAGLRIGDAILWLSSVLESGYE